MQNKPPFTLEQMIDEAITAIQLTGLCERALLEWQDFDEQNKTWTQLKLHSSGNNMTMPSPRDDRRSEHWMTPPEAKGVNNDASAYVACDA